MQVCEAKANPYSSIKVQTHQRKAKRKQKKEEAEVFIVLLKFKRWNEDEV